MQKTYCDKCLESGVWQEAEEQLLTAAHSLVDSKDKKTVRTKLDLCEKCRKELREVIYGWLYI